MARSSASVVPLHPNLTPEQQRAIALLATHTYEEVRQETGMSRGAIYQLACKVGARKHEARIQQRQAERRSWQEAFLREMINNTATADVLDYLAGLPDNSVSCHITSPPYNRAKSYLGSSMMDAMHHVYFHGWLMQVVAEMARTLKPGGVVCLNVGTTEDEDGDWLPMDVMLFKDLKRAGLTPQNRVVWTQPHGLTPGSKLAGRYETVLIFSKGPQATFNPNAARKPQRHPGKRAYKGPNKGQLSGHPMGAWPTDVWDDIPSVRSNHPDRKHGDHPAQFPVNLAKRAILLYTKPGDLVCDVFMGSGSSAVAAVESGRDFTGADLGYAELRSKRIAAATLDQVTMLSGVTDESAALWQAEAHPVNRKAKPITAAQEKAQCRALFKHS
jgi:DNA modification methylase